MKKLYWLLFTYTFLVLGPVSMAQEGRLVFDYAGRFKSPKFTPETRSSADSAPVFLIGIPTKMRDALKEYAVDVKQFSLQDLSCNSNFGPLIVTTKSRGDRNRTSVMASPIPYKVSQQELMSALQAMPGGIPKKFTVGTAGNNSSNLEEISDASKWCAIVSSKRQDSRDIRVFLSTNCCLALWPDALTIGQVKSTRYRLARALQEGGKSLISQRELNKFFAEVRENNLFSAPLTYCYLEWMGRDSFGDLSAQVTYESDDDTVKGTFSRMSISSESLPWGNYKFHALRKSKQTGETAGYVRCADRENKVIQVDIPED